MHPDAPLFEHFPGLVDHDNKGHYRGLLARELRINRCIACGHRHHPPLPLCPSCNHAQVVAEPVSGRGTVALYTWMHQGPPTPGVDYSEPYPVVAVELEEQPGLRFTTTIVDCDRTGLRIGLPVELDWIERNGIPFPVFRPRRSP